MKKSYTSKEMPVAARCIPISKDLKRYYWSKYRRMVESNGVVNAATLFTRLREQIMIYIDTGDRSLQGQEAFVRQLDIPVKKDGWLRALVSYSCTDAISVLQFLKLWTTERQPGISIEEAAQKQQELLDGTSVDREIDITAYLYLATLPVDLWKRQISIHRNNPNAFEQERIIKYHDGKITRTFKWFSTSDKDRFRSACYRVLKRTIYPIIGQQGTDNWISYVRKWRKMTRLQSYTREKSLEIIRRAVPTAASYSETAYGANLPNDGEVLQYVEDIWGYACIANRLALDSKYDSEFLNHGLSDEVLSYFDEVCDTGDDLIVGNLRHIPKKGTYKRRTIGDLNRNAQSRLAPLQRILTDLSGGWERNCMLNQSKMDKAISNSMQNGYAGSVDLSQATDNLPFYVFEQFNKVFGWFYSKVEMPEHIAELQHLSDIGYPISIDEKIELATWKSNNHDRDLTICEQSYEFFRWILTQGWDNEGQIAYYKKGQPMGALPSFNILTITQYLLAETASLIARRLDSPFVVLGDDIVFFDAKARQEYIKILGRMDVPISGHKSFEGRLTEFAGKIWVRNQGYAHTPSLSLITKGNLFDYQFASKKFLEWEDLPRSVKRDVEKIIAKNFLRLSPLDVYEACQAYLGIRNCCNRLSDESVTALTALMLSYQPGIFEKVEPDKVQLSGFFLIDGSVGFIRERFGNPQPRRKTEKWFKQKFRPETFDNMVKRIATCLPLVEATAL